MGCASDDYDRFIAAKLAARADKILRAPFPWFGGKSRAAPLIWDALGDVANYVEPFAGSLAVLLARPSAPRIETVNDRDCYLANFWRAVQHDPAAVAMHADWPVNEADLHARHAWLHAQGEFRERMLADPEFYDARVAGWWVWGLSSWIGTGWCDTGRTHPARQVRHLTGRMGVHRKIPNIDGNGGRGDAASAVRRQLPRVDGSGGAGDAGPAAGDLAAWFAALAGRLRTTRVVCGDWTRVLTPSVLRSHGATGVVLDPPYADGDMAYSAGSSDGISAQVREWAGAHGEDLRLRIVLCGYEGEHVMPASWRCVRWAASGGYANAGSDENVNRHRERLWLSPGCLADRQPSLFVSATEAR